MPNWCQCDVQILGPAARVREFLEFARSGDDDATEQLFDFNRFIPYPPIWAELDKAFWEWINARPLSGEPPVNAYDEWGYLWCGKNWGTVANARDATYGETTERGEELTATVRFDTPWSGPRPVILKASELFLDLRFELRYFEPTGDFCGTYRCAAGVATLDEWGPCRHEDWPPVE